MNKFTFQTNNENNGLTLVENIFINEFMPEARGEYVKVYLYALKLTQFPPRRALSDTDLAHILNLSVTDVIESWKYWEARGIIKLKKRGRDTEITFKNISESRLRDEEESELTVIKELPSEYAEAVDLVQEMLGQEITPTLYESIKTWIRDYHFTPMLVTYLIEYSLNRLDRESPLPSKVAYFKKVASGWHDEGFTDYREVIESMDKRKHERKVMYKVLENLGQQGRQLMESERRIMVKWFDVYGLSDEMILEAAARSHVNKISYVDAILRDWHEKGWKEISDIKDTRSESSSKAQETSKVEEDFYASLRERIASFENESEE